MENKYTIKADTTDLIVSEEGKAMFGEAHGPFTGFVVIGITKDEDGDEGATVMMHDVNAMQVAAAIGSHTDLRRIAMLAMLGGGKGGLGALLEMLGGKE